MTTPDFSDIINNYFSDNINKLLEENDGDVHNYIVSIIERALISQTLNTKGGNQLILKILKEGYSSALRLIGIKTKVLAKKVETRL